MGQGIYVVPRPRHTTSSKTAEKAAWEGLQKTLEALYRLQTAAPDVLEPAPTRPGSPATDADAHALLPDIPAVRAMYNACRERGDSPTAAIKAVQAAWAKAKRLS